MLFIYLCEIDYKPPLCVNFNKRKKPVESES